ncbi:hypothetical protein EF919_18230 [Streptomyces sp. WAC02707]|uniref:hypothetical protein n=1 Tax=Streptomyces TaxID=1883 RepID=UPI000F77AE0B|nr:hypothetical protein [Streptomyces sp. WAC02707]RSS92472.1 hypothetical protein EF919_18230 [Streptomyces sp. WAC02707]
MARTPARRARGYSPLTATLRTPLARWGFTTLAVLAFATAQTGPFLITTALAAYAWRNPTSRRPRRRR